MTAQTADAAVIETPVLSAADRCDRCGAQAYVKAELPGGGELLFCGHHGRAYAGALGAHGARLHDESTRLVETVAA